MLVLTRRVGEEIVIDDAIRVTVVGVQGSKVRLAISAPDSVRVDRQVVHELRAQFAIEASPAMLLCDKTGRDRASPC